ncbi:MAG: ArsA family ATPase [candidate division WOR-3 bacterium]
MKEFFNTHPNLKYIFFGGKGGVGKTVTAGMTALYLSEINKKVLLASTNPVHSLSGLLEQDVFGKETLVKGTNLYALEIDTKDMIAKKKAEIKEKVEWFLKYADISGHKAEDFIESATMNPAFEESAMFEKMVDVMFENKYDVYVFDTAPTANARRLLGMSKVYTLWVEKMLTSKKEADELKKKLSFSKKTETDPLLSYLLNFKERIERVHKLLTDEQITTFFFVTLAEALPIAVIKRFIGWFKEFGIPVGGVIVNRIIDKNLIKDNIPEFVLNRINTQEKYLTEIYNSFSNVQGIIPEMDKEIKGVTMLKQAMQHLF